MLLAILAFVAQMTAPPSPPAIASPSPAGSASPLPSPSASVMPSPSASPAFVVTPAALAMTPAQQRVLQVSGAAGPLSVTTGARLVSTSVDQTTQTVTVTATQATGTDVIHIIAGGAQVDVPVRVAFLAGHVSQQATLKVTGSPADPSWIAAQVSALVARLTRAMPGAQTTIASVTPPPAPLVPGDQTQFSVPVAIAGGDAYYDVSDTTTVTVQNVAVGGFLPQFLLYDDDPERLNADGVIFRGTIDASHPSRLYYYHDNGLEPRRLVLVLSTTSHDPSSVQVIDASAGPNIDVMSVGHAVSKNFLAYKQHNVGTIVDLDGETPFVLQDLPMQYRQGVAGAVGLRVLSGAPVTITVLAASPDVNPLSLLQGPILPSDGHNRTGVFTLANYGTQYLSYAVGGPDAGFEYGSHATAPQNVASNAPGHDYGDYGVLWNLQFTLTNPTAAPATVYLYERPGGGSVRSSFLVDDVLKDMGCVRVPQRYTIGAYTLQPSQTYRLMVETMTDGGSSYPLEVGMTTTAPQPTTPPISAPEGCFPKPQTSSSPALLPSPSPSASPSGAPK